MSTKVHYVASIVKIGLLLWLASAQADAIIIMEQPSIQNDPF